MTGLIAYQKHQVTVSCQVRDLSAEGAHLRCDTVVHVPNNFDLIIDLDGIAAACEVAWRKDKDIGVRFIRQPEKMASRRRQVITPLGMSKAPTLRRKRSA